MNKNKMSKRRPSRKSKSSVRVSKTVKRAVKQVLNKAVETKTINVPNPSGLANNNFVAYGALSGVQYLVSDVFKQPQGVENSTVIGAPNRIGDKVKGVGFLMDYYFSIPVFYTVGAPSFLLPYVKLRITVFKQAFGTPLLSAPLLYDNNFNGTFTSTLQPINWNEGYVKDVLMDRVFIIRNTNSNMSSGGSGSPNLPISGQVFHFKKYIKYDQTIKYSDNNSTAPNSTDKPIYIAISAEVDDSNVGLVPSGTKILFSTGYTRAWFKDA